MVLLCLDAGQGLSKAVYHSGVNSSAGRPRESEAVCTMCLARAQHVLSCSVMSSSLQPPGLQPTRLFCPWDYPSKNIGIGCHFLLQGIFLTHGSNLHLLCLLTMAGGFFTTEPPGKPCEILRYTLSVFTPFWSHQPTATQRTNRIYFVLSNQYSCQILC